MWCPLPIKMVQLRQIFTDMLKSLSQMLRIFMCLGQCTIILFDFPHRTTQLPCRHSTENNVCTGSERSDVL